jgi:hypothetical protein
MVTLLDIIHQHFENRSDVLAVDWARQIYGEESAIYKHLYSNTTGFIVYIIDGWRTPIAKIFGGSVSFISHNTLDYNASVCYASSPNFFSDLDDEISDSILALRLKKSMVK